MRLYHSNKLVFVLVILIAFVTLVTLFDILWLKLSGQPVPVPNIPRQLETFGKGQPLAYVVLGDSTAVGQGADYDRGIARATAAYLANDQQVKLTNFGVSGARAATVRQSQVDQAAKLKPDIVLISMGANDVTHVTPLEDVRRDTNEIIKQLKIANPDVKIILTGSPQMGVVPRLPQPLRYFAKLRTGQFNDVMDEIATQENITRAPIAEETGPIFGGDRSLFAQDNFHPNAAGYAVWIPVLAQAIDNSNK